MYLVKRLSQREAKPYMGRPNVLSFRGLTTSTPTVHRVEQEETPKERVNRLKRERRERKAARDRERSGQQMLVGGVLQPVITPGSANTHDDDHKAMRKKINDKKFGKFHHEHRMRQHPNVIRRNLDTLNEWNKEETIAQRLVKRRNKVEAIRTDAMLRNGFLAQAERFRRIKAAEARKQEESNRLQLEEHQRRRRQKAFVNVLPDTDTKRKKRPSRAQQEELIDRMDNIIFDSFDFRNSLN